MPSTSSSKKTTTKTTAKKATPTAKKTTKTPTKTTTKKPATSTAKKTTAATKKTTKTPSKTTVKKSTTTSKKTTATSPKTSVKKSTTSTPKQTVKDTKPELKTRVAKAWYGDDHKFEHFCKSYLQDHMDKFGIPKLNPKKTKDGGVDIISIKDDDWDGRTVFYVSVKNSKNKIGTEVIDALWGAMRKFVPTYDDADEHVAVVMTSGEFSSDAIAQAKKSRSPRTILIDGHKIDKEKRVD